MKRKIDVFEYAKDITTAISKGILITTKANKINAMTIGWGSLGIEWGLPIFTAYVRTGRFTAEQLQKNPEFTINIPVGDFNKKILGVCGSKSGRDIDKIKELQKLKLDKFKELNLTLVEGSQVSVPAIKELPLTLECKVIYRQTQVLSEIPADIQNSCYPQDVPSTFPMANKDVHIVFYGQIVDAYILE